MQEEKNDIYNKVTKVMISFKIPFGLTGFDYLRTAVVMCLEDESYISQITNKLYPRLAKKYETNQLHIERNIRSAIEKAYDLHGLLSLNEYCKELVYKNEYKFTNTEMICIIIELVKINLLKDVYIRDNLETKNSLDY